MKTLSRVLTITSIWLATNATVQAQMSQYKFNQIFQEAFASVLTADYQQAIPLLEELNRADEAHAQVSFLLAMSYLKTDQAATEAVSLLQAAVKRFNNFHQFGRVEDRSAPTRSWFFLAEAYMSTNRFAEAEIAYRNYMTTIPLASIADKKALIEKMERARNLELAQKHNDAQDGRLLVKAGK